MKTVESKLYRFETFVPKNLDQRQEKSRLFKERKVAELNELANKLFNIISTFKNLKIKDEKESFFIHQFIDCQIKIDYDAYPDKIFFFDEYGNYLSEYDSKSQEFWISYPNVWSPLEFNYNLDSIEIMKLTANWIEEHFKLKNVSTLDVLEGEGSSIEEHFKPIPAINI